MYLFIENKTANVYQNIFLDWRLMRWRMGMAIVLNLLNIIWENRIKAKNNNNFTKNEIVYEKRIEE